jgi:anti-sigma-K factor RskA
MTSSTTPAISDALAALSDEYVLGLLSSTEAHLIEELAARDPALAARIGALRDQFLPLDLSATPRDVAESFRAGLTEKLASLPQDDDILLTRAPKVPVAANLPRRPLRLASGLVAACALGIAVGLGGGLLRPVPDPLVVAVLLDADGVPQAVVEDYGNDSATVRFVADVAVPADRTLQVWTLPSQDMGPVSLGVLERGAAQRLTFDDLPRPAAQQLYEVTLEPLGGSPTGRPTGPIIGKGFAAAQI